MSSGSGLGARESLTCTAWRWVRTNRMPVSWSQTPSGAILVEQPQETLDRVALYARLSSNDRKSDLERQLDRLSHATANGMSVVRTVAKIGSGLKGHRPKLRRILAECSVTTIVVEHRDRLARFGSEYLQAALVATGRTLVVVDQSEMHDDLVQDMIDVLTSFCARLDGRRSAGRRARKLAASIAVLGPVGDRRDALLSAIWRSLTGYFDARLTRAE
jgi:putative resolvase